MSKTYEALMKAEKEGKRGPLPDGYGKGSKGREPRTSDHQLMKAYYRLKQNILRSDADKNMKTLLFSSCTKGEGNSTVLINFAMMLSSEGEKVLLVDTNLRSPSFHEIFNLNREDGVTELLLNKKTLQEVIKKTDYPNLFVITSGTPHSNPPILLESDSLDSLIRVMKSIVDWVLFDSPPVNSFDDSMALADRMDGVVMVIQAEKTRSELAQSAKQQLENAGGNILGVVLNKRRFYIPRWLYKTV
jgi:capsular exopolysaccharide synthesis family protein